MRTKLHKRKRECKPFLLQAFAHLLLQTMSEFPPNPYAKNLIPTEMAFGGLWEVVKI